MMRLNKILRLVVCLILTVGYLSHVHAVTDAELEALEKQIEQQEVEEKEQAEAEEKKKAAAEAQKKQFSEFEKQRQKELKGIEKEKLKLEEARKKLEVSRQFELERIRQEEEAKRKAKDERLRAEQEVRARTEAEAQRKEEESHLQREQQLFAEYMQNGESAMNKKEYSEALRAYTQALEIFPNDSAALRGKSLANDYKNLCVGVVC